MSLKIGIVGLPNVGKSTLFNALTKKQAAEAQNFPFTTIDPNVGIVNLPDPRLDSLAAIVSPEKVTPATVSFVDIAGLVRGAHKGEGLGNKFLANIREVDAIAMVVRDFHDPNVTHVAGQVNPIDDAQIIHTELALKDLETIVKRITAVEGRARTGEQDAKALLPVLREIKETLEQGRGVRSLPYLDQKNPELKALQLLTAKPLLYVLNIDETVLGRVEERIETLRISDSDSFAPYPIVPVSAKVEAELATLDESDQQEYLDELGLDQPGLNRVIRNAFDTLGLITYFTAGPKEVRAWTIPTGTLAPQAAGVIHGDFQQGFIRAEVIAFDDFVALGGEQTAKAAGKLRSEGKDYVVADGDVIHFRYNV